MTKMKRGTSKWIMYMGIGMALLVIGGFITWEFVDGNKEIQQIESKLGFDITVVDRQSHGELLAATRTYLVKPLEDDEESNIEYLLYLNKENKIEQWAKLQNGEIIKPIYYED